MGYAWFCLQSFIRAQLHARAFRRFTESHRPHQVDEGITVGPVCFRGQRKAPLTWQS